MIKDPKFSSVITDVFGPGGLLKRDNEVELSPNIKRSLLNSVDIANNACESLNHRY